MGEFGDWQFVTDERGRGHAAVPTRLRDLSGTTPGQVFAYGCARLIDVGASCEVGVLFEPRSAGDRSAVLTIKSDGGAPPKSVTLSGTGIR